MQGVCRIKQKLAEIGKECKKTASASCRLFAKDIEKIKELQNVQTMGLTIMRESTLQQTEKANRVSVWIFLGLRI